MATDRIIRELVIDIKQRGSAKTAKSIEGLATALTDAAAGAELTNEQLRKMPSTLNAIEKAANRAGTALSTVRISRGMDQMQRTLTKIEASLDLLVSTITHMSEGATRGFKRMADAAEKAGNDISRSVERVEDNMIDLNANVVRVNNSLNGTGNAGNRASRALGNTSGSARGAARDFAALARSGGGLTMIYAGIAANVYVLKAAFEQLTAGDQLNRLELFGTAIGSMTGTPVQKLASSLREATGFAVSFEEAMKQASMASAYGFDATQLGQFGLVARRAAAVLGIDMTDALNRVIKGVSKQEIELLDELGVTIRLNEAYAAHVKVLNAANTGITYNIQNLTTYQKQQAYANAVIAQSTKNLGALDHMLRTTPWEEFGANAEGALKRFQAAAAKYLTPIANTMNAIFYRSQNMETMALAVDQETSIAGIESNNAAALVNAASESRSAYTKFMDEQKKQDAEYAALVEKRKKLANYATGSVTWLVESAHQAIYNVTGNALGEGKAYEAQLATLNQIDTKMAKLEEEKKDRIATGQALIKTMQAAEEAVQKNPGLTKQVNALSGTGSFAIDDKKLEGTKQVLNEYTQFTKNSVKDISAAWGDLSNDNNIRTASSGYNQALKQIKEVATLTGESMDTLAQKSGLGVASYNELEKRYKSSKTYLDAIGNKEKDALAIEQAKNKALNSGSKTKDADNAANALKAQILDKQIAATKEMIAINPEAVALQKQLTVLETEKLQAMNSQMGTVEKTEKVRTKTIGIEKQIELAKDSSMSKDEYSLAQLRAQLDVEIMKAAALKGVNKQQDEYKQHILAIAQAEREIRDEIYSQTIDRMNSEREQANAMREASGELGTQEQIVANIRDREAEIKALREASASAGVAPDTKRIQDLENQIAVLKQQSKTESTTQNRGFQNATTGLLGGSYQSTQGMSPEQTVMQNMQNSQDGYAQAISNLQSINSEATSAGQSLGNLVNAMMQYSSGSLDFSAVAAAGMQTIGQFVSMGANQQISAIDAAIAAEQARDGQSEESKNKIKKLEAEKVKIQQQSAKQQILISTATAIMQAATSVPYPYSIPLMIAAAAAGAMSYAQASNPTSASLTGLDSGSSTTGSLTLGERQKNVDISQQANGGELSYMRGERGTGNANTFIPRAEGGNMVPGVSYAVGENGIEVVTPQVPSKITPADQVGAGSSGNGAPIVHLNVSAMDARSFRDFLVSNGASVRDAVESALNETGTSLKRLK